MDIITAIALLCAGGSPKGKDLCQKWYIECYEAMMKPDAYDPRYPATSARSLAACIREKKS